MSEEMYQKVFQLVVQRRSLPFLELSALSELNKDNLRQVLDDLEKKGMIQISDKENPFKAIITVREKAFTARPSFGD